MKDELRERVAEAIREAADELEGGYGWPEYAAENVLALLGLNDLDAAEKRDEAILGEIGAVMREHRRWDWDQDRTRIFEEAARRVDARAKRDARTSPTHDPAET